MRVAGIDIDIMDHTKNKILYEIRCGHAQNIKIQPYMLLKMK